MGTGDEIVVLQYCTRRLTDTQMLVQQVAGRQTAGDFLNIQLVLVFLPSSCALPRVSIRPRTTRCRRGSATRRLKCSAVLGRYPSETSGSATMRSRGSRGELQPLRSSFESKGCYNTSMSTCAYFHGRSPGTAILEANTHLSYEDTATPHLPEIRCASSASHRIALRQ